MSRHRDGWTEAVFAVLHRRDDLPEMPLPLVILCITVYGILMGLAGRCFSAAASAVSVDEMLGAAVWGIPLLPLAVTLFAAVLLLWRRGFALLAVPLAGGGILLFGGSIFCAIALSLISLVISYALALSLITRDSPFRRQCVVASVTAVSVGLGLAGAILVRFGGAASFFEAFMTAVPRWIGEQAVERMASFTGEGGTVTILEDAARETARQILVSFPALLGMGAILFGWVTEFLTRQLLRILDCEEVFFPKTEVFTVPFAYAAVYLGSVLLTLFIQTEKHPLLHTAFLSILWILALPCCFIGVRTAAWFLREKLYYVTHERLLSVILLLLAFAILGVTPFVLLLSFVGAIRVLKETYPRRRDGA